MSIAEPQRPSLQSLAAEFRSEIFAYIQSKVGHPAPADDLTQETFAKVGRALAKGTMPEHFRGWLYQIARNTTIDFLKESRRFVPLEDSTIHREAGKSADSDSSNTAFRRQLFSGDGPYSVQIIANLNALCREFLPERHKIEIIDLLREPERALSDTVMLTPMLVKLLPAPARKFFGNLSQRESLLQVLGISI